ncbi:MAG: efflux RND transporter periplasmic adaptor subunit [Candidatus Zixiibacteriota bacterium]
MLKKFIWISIVIIIVGAVVFFGFSKSSNDETGFTTIEAKKGTIIDKALAVGQIEPRKEIAIKSKISGIVKRIYVEIGDAVEIGDPLIDVAPDPTPIEYAEAKKQVEIYQVAFDNTKREYDRAQSLVEKELIHRQEFDSKKAEFEQADLRLNLAREKLELIESGKTTIADRNVDNVIKSPARGIVLSRLVEEGNPVVPLTSYQAGTDLMTLAYMEDLIFKGTVDEIDVGKLAVGMEAEIKIGALPKDTVRGTVERISPKAHQDQGSTVFDVEIKLIDRGSNMLRAGYSANADIIILKKEDILLIPERLIEFKDDSAFVEITTDSMSEKIDTILVETGLSDGIQIEILSGLAEGDKVIERPPREI